MQIAGGVPFKLGETVNSKAVTFRLGLFGLDKLKATGRTVARFEAAVDAVVAGCREAAK